MEANLSLDRANQSSFSQTARALAESVGRDVADVIIEQGALLVDDLIASTPPFSVGSNGGEALVIGQAAVKRDIRRVFRPITSLGLYINPQNKQIGKQIRKAVQTGNAQKAQQILRKSGVANANVIAKADDALHQSARNERGVVPKNFQAYIVLDGESIESYQSEVMSRVGKAKAGWETAARALKVAVPSWISSHNTPGRFEDNTKNKSAPSIFISNDVSYGDSFSELQILENALARRIAAMQSRMNEKTDQSYRRIGAVIGSNAQG